MEKIEPSQKLVETFAPWALSFMSQEDIEYWESVIVEEFDE